MPTPIARRAAAALSRPASPIFTWYSEHIASQKRGGAMITCGPISRRSSRRVACASGKLTVAPACSAMATLMSCSPTHENGRNDTMSSVSRTRSTCVTPVAIATRLRWLSIAAFGSPVVPDVYASRATSSGLPRSSRAS